MNRKIHLNQNNISDKVRDYYRGERISNALLFFIGSGAVIWTLLLYLWRGGQFSTGLFYSSLPLAIFFIVTGMYRFLRSFKRYKMAQDVISGERFLKNEELQHLIEREKRFFNKRKVDMVSIIVGIVLLSASLLGGWNHLILGTSISLTIFSIILLTFDLFGQYRTTQFVQLLKNQFTV